MKMNINIPVHKEKEEDNENASEPSSPVSPILKKLDHHTLKELEGLSSISHKFENVMDSFFQKAKEWNEYTVGRDNIIFIYPLSP